MKTKKKPAEKWLVSETFTYEVEAMDENEACKKVQSMSGAERTCIGQNWGVESWWTESRKDEVATLILESLEKKFGEWPSYKYKESDIWWAKTQKLFKKHRWTSGDIREKHLFDDDGLFCIHPDADDPSKVAFGMIHEEESVYYVEMDKEDALRILTLGVPF